MLARALSTSPASAETEAQPAGAPAVPYSEETRLTASPFSKTVQAWMRDFQTSQPIGIQTLNSRVFAGPLRVDLMHRAVIWQRDGMRQGTAATKGISDIRGTTRKAAPQKGRGMARVGTYRAPQFRGGATVFGPKPRDHSTNLQHKVQLAALRSALSTKYQQDQLVVVDALRLETLKTRDLNAILHRHLWQDSSLLFVTGRSTIDSNLEKAARNLQSVECTLADEMDVYRMLQRDVLVLDGAAVRKLEKKLYVS
ncbi:ribosomal protein L4 domain-containing protein [Thamnocephalis sphaerospora]|uniref:Large ribosomal subunit protein uL4m n=1 Tax=Thamnocephalis sphaerospora TaxID=78915 RepID=A0A4P9XXI4_9FUNG|nr:ribosomal protein L4 domain-containing protein [Thamnocephalis sphaerospora]|eukprot:RKP11088.1 ribosomal protein L4 domain-containing protein [Thamnocephalis sphaerospora]